MKKLLFFSFFLFFSSLIYSQSNTIDKIGKLKIYSSFSVLSEIGYNTEPIRIVNSSDYYKATNKKYSGNNIYELIADTTLKNDLIYSSFCAKVYYIPTYAVTDELVLKGITLKFINDSLYDIYVVEATDLADAFSLKYGDPEIKVDEENKYYTNGLGMEIVKTDKVYTQSWKTNIPQIKCVRVLSVYHDSEGERNVIQFLNLYDTKINKRIGDCDKKRKEEIKKEIEKKKKSALDAL